MDLKIEELSVIVQQMQTTHLDVLQRIEQISDETGRTCDQCQCSKHLQDALSEIKTLKSRVQVLEEQGAVGERSLKSAEDQLHEIQARLEIIELNVQTDDSKLKKFELVRGKSVTNAQVTSHSLRHKQDSILNTSSEQAADQSEATLLTSQVETAEPIFVKEDDTTVGASVPEQHGPRAERGENLDHQIDSKNHVSGIKEAIKEKNLPLTETCMVKVEKFEELTLGQETPIKHRNIERPMTGNIAKPNFEGWDSAVNLEVEMVEQKEKKTYQFLFDWEIQARDELKSAKQTEPRHLHGFHDVIVLDISASMASAWSQVRTFITDFLSGLEDTVETGLNIEYVALVTFGHETKVQQRLTKNFSAVRQVLGRLKVGGPSPLNAGMMFALAVDSTPECRGTINGISNGTRFILITDGKPTDLFTHQGPDIPDTRLEKETTQLIASYTEKIRKVQGELCCVPVGNANKEFLNTLLSFCDGKMVDYTDGRQLSRKVSLLGVGLSGGEEVSEEDRTDIEEFRNNERGAVRVFRARTSTYLESTNTKLPKVGSRVRRGPDWHYGNQDSEGPGTVIGHCIRDKSVHVNWDTNSYIGDYRYGEKGQYDVLLVDEPRRLGPRETIAVGCIVKPGPYWKPGDGVAENDSGVVIKLDLGPSYKPQATVRWDNGKRGNYSYDVDDNPEIQVCSEISLVTQAGEKQHSLPPPQKSKFKNKNKTTN